MTGLWQDVRYGIRVLTRARGFTILAILLLGLGIGASTVLFSAINGILLRPLPYTHPDRLVVLWESNPELHTERAGTSAPTFLAWTELSRSFAGLAAYRRWGFDLAGNGEPERIAGARVSASLFPLLGIEPVRGRTLVASDERPGQRAVALVSEELWRRRFGAEPGLVGTSLHLDGQPYTVVGIIPRGFALPAADVWVPLRFAPYELEQRGNRALAVIGRLKTGTGIAAGRADMRSVAAGLAQQFPDADSGWRVNVIPLQHDIAGQATAPLLLLFCGTCAVLLVACANLVNLLLARSTARRRELALRAALGASRLRVARHQVIESLLIVTAAGMLGVPVAVAGIGVFSRLDAGLLPRGADIGVDPTVLAFALLVSLVAGASLGVIPAFDAARLDLTSVMKRGGASRPGRWSGLSARDVPVAGQIAVALLLLTGGGLLVRSFIRVQAVDLGFSPDHVLSMTVSLPNYRYPAGEARAAFFVEFRRQVASLPGVRSAGLTSHTPLAGSALQSDFAVEGRPVSSAADVPGAQLVNVTPGYFETLRIRVLKGRLFTERDRADTRPVAIIDDTLARRFWPAGDAIGARVRIGATLGADSAWREIVGIVAGVRSAGPERDPAATIYVPHAQNPWPTMVLVVRTAVKADRYVNPVIERLRALDKDEPVFNVRSMDELVGGTLAARRLQALLMTGFSGVAFLLAVVGAYGMLAYAVAQRARDLAIRVTLGAGRRQIVWHCLRRAIVPVGAGLLAGTVAACVAATSLRALLFGVDPWDPATWLASLSVVTIASVVACSVPAVRAARADPLRALRSQ